MDVVQKIWGFCNVLKHDGINYGDYIEQLTYLLFLKLAEEKGLSLPAGYDWPALREKSGTDLTDHYQAKLRELGKQPGLLGDIFAGSLSRFREPVNLKRLIGLIDEIAWSELDVDLKGTIYEGLLQKFAAEQKGAGQYFTPRPLIRSICRVMQPDLHEAAGLCRARSGLRHGRLPDRCGGVDVPQVRRAARPRCSKSACAAAPIPAASWCWKRAGWV